jgi:outer membrane protein W
MKLIKFFAVIFVLAVCLPANAQIKFSAGPTVGVTMPQGDYSGSSTDYYAGLKYGLGTGINFGAVFKAKLPIVSVKAGLSYTMLSSSGLANPSESGSFTEVKHRLFTISVGPEFYFSIPASPIKPYAGVDLLLTTFSGETTFRGISGVPSGTYDLSSASRTGLGFGVGAEFSLGKTTALDFNIKYNLINIFSKEYEGPYDSDRRLDAYVFLNDAKDPRYPDDLNDHPVGSDRNISTLQLNLAFLFGF